MLWRTVGYGMLLFCSQSQAAIVNHGAGLVGLSGSIIETPCAIDTGSRDQSIDMGTLPLGVIANKRVGPSRSFSILLVNCTVSRASGKQPNWQRFQVTFEGTNVRGLFGVTGGARGVGLLLTDRSGAVIRPSEPAPAGMIVNADQRLDYRLRLAGNGGRLHSGDYYASLRFHLDYY